MTAQLLDYPPDFVEPAYLWVPPGRRGTYGDEIVDFSASIGHEVDAEQAAAIDAMASYGPGGFWHTLEVGIVEGRQNGKTDRTILPITAYSFFVKGTEHIGWTAQLMKTTKDVFNTVCGWIEEYPALSRRVKEISESKSEVSIELMTGAVWDFGVRSARGGRGEWPYDEQVMDEALFVTGEQIAARMPTMRSRPNPQLRYASSAAVVESDHLRNLVKRGRAYARPGGVGDSTLTWVEYCGPGSFADPGCARGRECTHEFGVEQGCTLDDESLWHLSNHRIGRSPGVSYAYNRAERKTMKVIAFAREIRGWHQDGIDSDKKHPLDADAYRATAVEASPDRASSPPAFFVTIGRDNGVVIAVAYDRPELDPITAAWATLQAGDGPVFLPDTRPHVELAANRKGSDWLAERLSELKEQWPGARFAAAAKGPVKRLVDARELPVEVELLGVDEIAQACRHHEDLNNSRRYTHSADVEVDQAFRGAVSKPADGGLWLWDWKESVGLAPIAAEGGALYVLNKHRAGTGSTPGAAPVPQDDAEQAGQLATVRELWRPSGRLEL